MWYLLYFYLVQLWVCSMISGSDEALLAIIRAPEIYYIKLVTETVFIEYLIAILGSRPSNTVEYVKICSRSYKVSEPITAKACIGAVI